MSPPAENKSDSDAHEEDGPEEVVEDSEHLNVDILIRSMDKLKRRGTRLPDPAWRRLERYREQKHTEEMLSDFEDYDIGREIEEPPSPQKESAASRARKKRKH